MLFILSLRSQCCCRYIMLLLSFRFQPTFQPITNTPRIHLAHHRFGCIVDAGVGKDEDGVVIYEETEEGQKVKSISADNPLHIAACLGEVNNGKSSGNRASSTWEEMREELNVAIDQMTDVEFAGYVSCLAEEREEGGLYETESDALNTALQVASEISDGVYNAQLEVRGGGEAAS